MVIQPIEEVEDTDTYFSYHPSSLITDMKTSIPSKKKKKLFGKLGKANASFQKIYPGDRTERQPVHTVYGGANLFKYNSARILAERGLESFQTYAPDFLSF